jgi:hydrogenase maturation factor
MPPAAMHAPKRWDRTALQELAAAANATLRVDPGTIRVYDETRAICAALELDPMGLLASGALLAIISAEDEARLASRRNVRESNWHTIATVESGPARVILGAGDPATPFPTFARDELARFFDSGDESKIRRPEGS